jgi:nucleoside-diphosphate-sugar epimerase
MLHGYSRMKKRLLVVGGSGFIGRYVCENANEKGYSVTSLSPNNVDKNLRVDNVEYLTANITNLNSLKKVLKNININYVINLAGYIDHSHIYSGGENVISVHFEGLRNLIKTTNTSDLIRFIQIGTSDEYNGGVTLQNENQREQPFSSYSFAKVASTYYVQMLNRETGFPGIILRPFLVYGPRQSPIRLIPQIIKGCLNDDTFKVTKGEQLRDFSYVTDVANMILLALETENINGEILNIGSGEPIKIKDIVIKINKYIGKGHPVFGGLSYRRGEKMELLPDMTKSLRLLNYNSKIDINEGIIKTIESFR